MAAVTPLHAAPPDAAWPAAAADAPADAALHSAGFQVVRPVQAPEAPRTPDAALPLADEANGFTLPADQLQPVTLIGLQVQPGDGWPLGAQARAARWRREGREEVREEGREEGLEEGLEEGQEAGQEEGAEQGEHDGERRGAHHGEHHDEHRVEHQARRPGMRSDEGMHPDPATRPEPGPEAAPRRRRPACPPR